MDSGQGSCNARQKVAHLLTYSGLFEKHLLWRLTLLYQLLKSLRMTRRVAEVHRRMWTTSNGQRTAQENCVVAYGWCANYILLKSTCWIAVTPKKIGDNATASAHINLFNIFPSFSWLNLTVEPQKKSACLIHLKKRDSICNEGPKYIVFFLGRSIYNVWLSKLSKPHELAH